MKGRRERREKRGEGEETGKGGLAPRS